MGSGLLVLNKPAGVPVHGPGGLDIIVQKYLYKKIPASLSFRPGPLHRLDQPTSGILVFSTSLAGAHYFTALTREGRLVKGYLALVEGLLTKEEVWEDRLVRDSQRHKTLAANGAVDGKAALTRVRPLASAAGLTLVRAVIGTGRTHQIRAQAALHGHPLAGDRKYGGGFQPEGFLLHAHTLTGLPVDLCAPPPPAFCRRVEELFPGLGALDRVGD